MKVYVVVFDGYLDDYGERIYLQGVYTNKEEATKQVESINMIFNKEYNSRFSSLFEEGEDDALEIAHVVEVELDKGLNVMAPTGSCCDSLWTDICLGSYVE